MLIRSLTSRLLLVCEDSLSYFKQSGSDIILLVEKVFDVKPGGGELNDETELMLLVLLEFRDLFGSDSFGSS